MFELDHPETQRVKKERLAAVFGRLPDHVTFVPVDLQGEDIAPRLFAGGYRRDRSTLFIWEGVTMYLVALAELCATAFQRYPMRHPS